MSEIVKKEVAGALTTMEQEIAIEAKNDAASFVQSTPRIQTKSGVFAIDGAKVKDNKLTVAIVSTAFGKAYYAGEYDPDVPQSPVCYGFHPTDAAKIAPHEKAPEKQADACAGCKWNKFGTALRGNGKRCKDEIRLMCVVPTGSDLSGAEVRLLSVPPGSLDNFRKYVSRLADMQATVRSVMTEITIEPYKGAYRLVFNPAGKLSEEAYLSLRARRDTALDQSMQPYPVLEDEPEDGTSRKRRARAATKLD